MLALCSGNSGNNKIWATPRGCMWLNKTGVLGLLRVYSAAGSSSCSAGSGFEITERTFNIAHIMPKKADPPVAMSIVKLSTPMLYTRNAVLPKQTIAAIMAQTIDAWNFFSRTTGATPTIATTNMQYFMAMNRLLMTMATPPFVSKFESNLLNTNP